MQMSFTSASPMCQSPLNHYQCTQSVSTDLGLIEVILTHLVVHATSSLSLFSDCAHSFELLCAVFIKNIFATRGESFRDMIVQARSWWDLRLAVDWEENW